MKSVSICNEEQLDENSEFTSKSCLDNGIRIFPMSNKTVNGEQEVNNVDSCENKENTVEVDELWAVEERVP